MDQDAPDGTHEGGVGQTSPRPSSRSSRMARAYYLRDPFASQRRDRRADRGVELLRRSPVAPAIIGGRLAGERLSGTPKQHPRPSPYHTS
jgi:hypothetical protein